MRIDNESFRCICGKVHRYAHIFAVDSECECGRMLNRVLLGKKPLLPWRMDETGVTNDGDVGGDSQVGEAWSARFINPDLPRCFVDVTVFVSAPELAVVDQPECPHMEEPPGWKCRHGWDYLHNQPGSTRCMCWLTPEHLACTHDVDSLGIETFTEYVITRENMPTGGNPWDHPEWEERSAHESLDTRPFHRDVDAANRAAQFWIRGYRGASIDWDGEPF